MVILLKIAIHQLKWYDFMKAQCFTFLIDLLFEWLYKNEALQALGDAGYFDTYPVAEQLDLESLDTPEDHCITKENVTTHDECCDDLISKVCLL